MPDALTGGGGIRVTFHHYKIRTAVVQNHTCAGDNNPRAEYIRDAGDERYGVAVLIHHGEVRRIAVDAAGGGRKLRPVQQNVAFQCFAYGIYGTRCADGLHGASFDQGYSDEHLYFQGICSDAGSDVGQ